MQKIELTINGKGVQATAGMTVLEAARLVGIQIPALCDVPDLTPNGKCRLCVVEIENQPEPVTACTTPVSNGMVVHTETPAVRKLRQGIL